MNAIQAGNSELLRFLITDCHVNPNAISVRVFYDNIFCGVADRVRFSHPFEIAIEQVNKQSLKPFQDLIMLGARPEPGHEPVDSYMKFGEPIESFFEPDFVYYPSTDSRFVHIQKKLAYLESTSGTLQDQCRKTIVRHLKTLDDVDKIGLIPEVLKQYLQFVP